MLAEIARLFLCLYVYGKIHYTTFFFHHPWVTLHTPFPLLLRLRNMRHKRDRWVCGWELGTHTHTHSDATLGVLYAKLFYVLRLFCVKVCAIVCYHINESLWQVSRHMYNKLTSFSPIYYLNINWPDLNHSLAIERSWNVEIGKLQYIKSFHYIQYICCIMEY